MQHSTQSGKWATPGVPHRGWRLVGVYDLRDEDREAPLGTCEMCETAEIRFVHTVEHEDYPETLGVGCICCEHMTEDYVNPLRHEKELQSRAGRRERFANSKRWRRSAKGNATIRTQDRYWVTIFEKGDHFRVWVKAPGHSEGEFGTLAHRTEEAAKISAFNYLEHLRSN